MRESLVGFSHAMYVFLLLDGPAPRVTRVDQLIGVLVDHGLAGALARILQEPANRQRLPPERVHFHGNLVVCAAHPPRLHLQHRFHVLHGLLENLQRVVIALLRHLIHGAVKHPLRRGLLAFPHHRANELLDEVAVVHRIVGLWAPADDSFAWHVSRSLLKSLLRYFVASLRLTSAPPSAVSLRTSSAPACDSPLPPHPASRARCDSARRAGPSRGRRAPARWSAPASCGRCRECTWSPRPSSSSARAPPCATRSSVSSAFACTRECTRRAFPGSPSAPATSS